MMQLTLHSKDTSNSEFQWPSVGLNYITKVRSTLGSVDHGVFRMHHSIPCIEFLITLYLSLHFVIVIIVWYRITASFTGV